MNVTDPSKCERTGHQSCIIVDSTCFSSEILNSRIVHSVSSPFYQFWEIMLFDMLQITAITKRVNNKRGEGYRACVTIHTFSLKSRILRQTEGVFLKMKILALRNL